MNIIRIIFFFLVSLSLSSQSLAINKCTDGQGKISFQDKPCPSASEMTVIQSISPSNANGNQSVNNPDIKIVDVNLTNGKSFSVGVPGNWQDSIRLGNETVPTLRVVSSNGEPLILLMTFIPKRQSVGLDNIVLNEVMQGIADQHSNSKSERKIGVRKVDLVFAEGVGHLLTYIDDSLVKNINRKSDEFSFITTGALIIEGMVINVSILTNDIKSDNYAKALIAVHTITN